jgi:hypothetical protein
MRRRHVVQTHVHLATCLAPQRPRSGCAYAAFMAEECDMLRYSESLLVTAVHHHRLRFWHREPPSPPALNFRSVIGGGAGGDREPFNP